MAKSSLIMNNDYQLSGPAVNEYFSFLQYKSVLIAWNERPLDKFII